MKHLLYTAVLNSQKQDKFMITDPNVAFFR